MTKCPRPDCKGEAKPAESGGMICRKCGQCCQHDFVPILNGTMLRCFDCGEMIPLELEDEIG